MKHPAFPEAYIWLIALIFLACMEPSGHHWSICPLANAGLDFCPGCGLGRSISHLFHGNWFESWDAHPLAAPAVIILVGRIIHLFRISKTTTNYGTSY